MKLLLATAALLFTVVAQATPRVGDVAEFAATQSQNGQSISGTLTMAIVSEAGDTVAVVTTIQVAGQPAQQQQENAKKADMLTDQVINDVLTNCASYGGAPEQVTVPAGTFASCKLAIADQTGAATGNMWIALVPFGVAKQVSTTDGIMTTLDLQRYVNGQ